MLGAAGGQIAFNLGSAIGAFCGGMMIAQGFGWNSVALPAATLSFSGDERLAHLWLLISADKLASDAYSRQGFAKGQHQPVGPGEKGRRLQQIQLGQGI